MLLVFTSHLPLILAIRVQRRCNDCVLQSVVVAFYIAQYHRYGINER